MKKHTIRFTPVYGGYAVHHFDCRHNHHHPYGNRRPLVFTEENLTDAVAALYRSSPVGILTPDRFEVRSCASYIPLAATDAPWEEQHGVLLGRAARSLWVCIGGAAVRARDKISELLEDVQELERTEQWCPDAGMLRGQIAATCTMQLWETVRADDEQPQEDDTETCRRFVRSAEAALHDAMERLVLEEGRSPDPLDDGVMEAERTGTRMFVKAVRSCLAPVHAHRALRDVSVRPDR